MAVRTIDLSTLPPGYSSQNTRKYASRNPLVQMALRRFLSTVQEMVSPLEPKTILDVGCGEGIVGHGLMSGLATGRPRSYFGIDRSVKALEAAVSYGPRGQFACMEMPQMGLKDRSVDLILCLEVLEHLQDPSTALAELGRVSARHCLISVPHEPFFRLANFIRGKHLRQWGNHPEHLHHWSPASFRELLAGHFQVRELRRIFPWLVALCDNLEVSSNG